MDGFFQSITTTEIAVLMLGSSVVAAVIASALSAVGTVVQEHQARKREFSTVLYSLMRIWDVLFSLHVPVDTNVLREAVRKEMLRRYPHLPDEEVDHFVDAMGLSDGLLPDMRDRMIQVKKEGPLRERYQQSVQSISSRDPVLAFSLSSNQSMESILDQIDRSMRSNLSGEHFQGTVDNEEKVEEQLREARRMLAGKIVEDMENDLYTVARKSGWWIRLRTRWKIHKIKKRRRILSPDSEAEPPTGMLFSLLEKYLQKEDPHTYEELQNYRRFSNKTLQNLWLWTSRVWPW